LNRQPDPDPIASEAGRANVPLQSAENEFPVLAPKDLDKVPCLRRKRQRLSPTNQQFSEGKSHFRF